MNRIFWTALCFSLLCLPAIAPAQEAPAPQPAQEQKIDDTSVILTIDGMPITLKQFFDKMASNYPDEYQWTINRFIAELVVDNRKRELGVQVEDADLDIRMEARLKDVRDKMREKFEGKLTLEQYLETMGKSMEQFTAELRVETRKLMEAEHMLAYNALQNGRAQLHLIAVKDETLAKDLLERIKQGESFAELAQKHSVHQESAGNGGCAGYFCKNLIELHPEYKLFKDFLQNAKDDSLSDLLPVFGGTGFAIVLLSDFQAPVEGTYEQLKNQVKELVDSHTISSTEIELWILKAKADAKIETLYDPTGQNK